MRPTEKVATIIASIIFTVSSIFVYITILHKYGTEIPAYGGTVNEGIIGYARLINPILAFTDTDKDLTALIYSGILKATPDGKLIPDLAESVELSDDGLVYTVKLKPDLSFHDGKPLTTEDIEFTIQKAIDPQTKSTKAINWSGVTVEKVGPNEIKFILKKPYAPFEENLTLGILPKHIWGNISSENFDVSEYNKEPIGSGPYKIKSIKQDISGIPESYSFSSFKKYALGRPLIDNINLLFYANEDDLVSAFKKGDIDVAGGISPNIIESIVNDNEAKYIVKDSLPRVFGVFFNQNVEPVFIHKEVRKALSESVNRKEMIGSILKGYGIEAYSPIPASLSHVTATSTLTNQMQSGGEDLYINNARKTLEDAGWKISTSTNIYEKKTKDKVEYLAFTISTSNSPELKATAEILQAQWTKLGAEVKIEIFESSDLTQKIIRPRKYSALLFGQVIGRDLDLYPFWHSSQRVDPGLNIALYANIKADKALDTARSTSNQIARSTARSEFEREVINDIPATFLFSPEYVYLLNKDIKHMYITSMTESSERFMNIHAWYIDTKHIWKKNTNK